MMYVKTYQYNCDVGNLFAVWNTRPTGESGVAVIMSKRAAVLPAALTYQCPAYCSTAPAVNCES